MKIKNRLWASFFIMVVLPVIIVLIIILGFVLGQLRHFQTIYGAKPGDYSLLMNSYQAYENMTDAECDKIHEIINKSANAMLIKDNHVKINKELISKRSALIVRQNESIIFDGTNNQCWGVDLPVFGSSLSMSDEGMLVGDAEQVILKQIDFESLAGDLCSVFVITKAAGVLPETANIVMGVVVGLIMLVLITGVGLTFWTSKGIMAPIRKLETATKRISQGDLDFTIESDRDDEIGQLCVDFEQMRKRLKESAEEKIEQDKQYKILISNICHDLKTPITAIQGYVEGLIDGIANTPEKQEKYIKTIHSKASEMNTLINELTIYSKLDTNRVPYNFQKLKVKDYFEDCIDEISFELETKEISLGYFNYCSEDVLIIADPEQLSRVIHNIVSNAVKYMNRPKRQINFRIKDVGDFIQVEIEDSGKGIAAKDLPFIFDRFYRADSSRNETKGSGIGLSIVKKIMEDHGGQIWATSKENIGTTMYFVLRKYQEVPNE